MGINLPGEVAGLLNDLGYTWPEVDEDKLFDMGRRWLDYGGKLEGISTQAQNSAAQVWNNNHGPAVDAFKAKWEHEHSPAAVLKDGGTAAYALGGALFVCALIVLILKINVIVQLIILLCEIIEALATAAPSFGASLLEIPVFKEIQSRIINLLINEAMNQVLG